MVPLAELPAVFVNIPFARLMERFPRLHRMQQDGLLVGPCPAPHDGDLEAQFLARETGNGWNILPCDLGCLPSEIWEASSDDDGNLDTPALPLTDIGNAERLVRDHGGDLRFCHPWGKWLVWDGFRWKVDDTAEVIRRAKYAVRAIAAEASHEDDGDRRKAILRHALRSEDAKRLQAMLTLARSELGIPVVPDQFDADPMLLNLNNGTLDLRSGELRRHRREDLITKLAPVSFDATATCPTWDAFLSRIMGHDAELIAYLRRAAGYALTGDVGAHALFFPHGGGANGKSTFLNTLSRLLGEYAVKVPTEILLTARGERHSTDKTMLHGARLAVCQEVNEGRRFDLAAVKGLTGGDPVTARRMREDNWTWTPTHKLWLATNSKPRVSESDEATWRRILLIPFEVTIPEEERDPALPEKLAAELPGILRWTVEGCLEWQRVGGGMKGLGAPRRVRDATRSYREEEDLVGAFVYERCTVADGARVGLPALWTAYTKWCELNHDPAGAKVEFNARIQRLAGVEKAKSNGAWVWRGISLREAPLRHELREVPCA